MRRIAAILLLFALAGCGSFAWLTGSAPVYAVFFDDGSIVLTAAGKSIVDHAADDARHHPGAMVEISGPSTKAATGYDPAVSEARIHLVEQSLIQDGIAPQRLFRASSPAGKVKAGATGAQRVEIRLVDKPTP
ncbi:MAG: hypothetical protein ACREHF_10450 [Rhizomicrobium sp.]